MKKLLFISTCIFVQLSVSAQTFYVEKWQWVEYYNKILQPWSNTITLSDPINNDVCGIEPGGTLEVLSCYTDEIAMVIYRTDNSGMGTPCENGVITFVSYGKLLMMPKAPPQKTSKEKMLEYVDNYLLNNPN